MTANERRYTEDEVRAIFEAARERPGDELPGRLDAAATDLTLPELRQIAGEVGLSPERVTGAALALDEPRSATPARRSVLGAPLTVSRVIDLPRAPTDAEWEILVGEMRALFGARGTLGGSGDLRDWSNGNLHVAVEPTEAGHRMRLATLKGNAAELETSGVAAGVGAVLVAGLMAVTGEPHGALMLGGMLGGVSAALLGANAVRLPRWARQRARQFDHLAGRVRALLGDAPANHPAADPLEPRTQEEEIR